MAFHRSVLSHEAEQMDQPLLNPIDIDSSSYTSARTIFKLSLPNDISSMETKITYSNAEAEKMRQFYQQMGKEELEKYFDDYFTAYYGLLEKKGFLEIDDDAKKNIFSIKANYILKEFWQKNLEEQAYYFTIFPKHILEAIDFNINPLSSFPLPLNHPVQISEHITFINENEEWPVTQFQKNFSSNEMNLSYANESEGKELHFIYLYMTKKDHVPLGHLGKHRKFVIDLQDHLITVMGIPMESMQKTVGFKNENDFLLGILTVCYGWLIFMLTKKGKKHEMV